MLEIISRKSNRKKNKNKVEKRRKNITSWRILINEEELKSLEELESFKELENFPEIKAAFESFSENKKIFENFLENKEEFKSFLEIKDKLKDFLEVKSELKSLLEKRDKLKKRWDKISIDLKEEKLRVNSKILLLERSNNDYVYSTMIGFISILIVFVTFGYSQRFKEKLVINMKDINSILDHLKFDKDLNISKISETLTFDTKFVAIFIMSTILIGFGVLVALRHENQKSICELNYYKIYLEDIEEVEKELADKKAAKKRTGFKTREERMDTFNRGSLIGTS